MPMIWFHFRRSRTEENKPIDFDRVMTAQGRYSQIIRFTYKCICKGSGKGGGPGRCGESGRRDGNVNLMDKFGYIYKEIRIFPGG
jgi:hypothetical protein